MQCCCHGGVRMRLLSVCVVVASLISAAQGQGFLADVMSLISRLNPFTQQQQSSRPAAPVFRPRPAPAEPAPAPASDPMPFSGPVTSPQVSDNLWCNEVMRANAQ